MEADDDVGNLSGSSQIQIGLKCSSPHNSEQGYVTAPINSVNHDTVYRRSYDGTSNVSKYTSYTAAALKNIRCSPKEEFFTLCLLTIKMKYEGYDNVMRIKSKELFKKASTQKGKMMEFTEFYEWIEKEVQYV